jgi:formylglycine-generating enzyme required for sulfatase activity
MRWSVALSVCFLSVSVAAAPKTKPAPKAAAPAAPKASTSSATLDWVTIPGGEFHYGCEPKDTDCADVEKPGTDVSQPGFEMTRTEVTVEQYRACVEAKKCEAPNGGQGGFCNWNEAGHDHYPIACVDQAMARTFCAWAGGRLPKAVEWEFAAKGGTSRIYPWGNTPPDAKKAVFQLGEGGSKEVGTHSAGASKHGLQDMSGNVWEWTDSTFSEGLGEVRGGAWRNPANVLRASRRGRRPAADRADWIGFRCAK